MYLHLAKLNRDFFNQNTLKVARELIGKNFIHESKEGLTVNEIVETEAYIGPFDPASHAYGGRRTARTEIQFGPRGHAYIYQIHGLYFCFDIVTGPVGQPEVVLIRALRPVYGVELMAKRRGIEILNSHLKQRKMRDLCNGPGKLCQAMGINKDHNGIDLCSNTIYLEDSDSKILPSDIAITPRIGINYAGKAKDYPWRFCLYNCAYVSKAIFR
jgi:DNA-3-methyladenine glycosylase